MTQHRPTAPIVLIAADGPDATRWLASQPYLAAHDVVWVSPRSSTRARGVTALAVLQTDAARAMPGPIRNLLLAETLPCVAWR